jgi:hypothetical protein
MADIIANMTTPQALTAAVQAGLGTSEANVDQMGWYFESITGVWPPAPESYGYPGPTDAARANKITADAFLTRLRDYLLSVNAGSPTPGGGTTSQPGPTGGGAPTGQGVLGPTNCKVCQQLQQNPILLVVVAVALYYLFVD